MSKLLLIHGPNLNLLGDREPLIYGSQTLPEVNAHITQLASTLGHELAHYQSNAEHELIQRIHQAKSEHVDFILINPAALTHTSVALRDALLAVAIPFIEIHLSNPKAREEFRHHSYFTDIAVGEVSGFGTFSYELALQGANNYLKG